MDQPGSGSKDGDRKGETTPMVRYARNNSPKRKGGQRHRRDPVARVVVAIRPKLRNKDRSFRGMKTPDIKDRNQQQEQNSRSLFFDDRTNRAREPQQN